MLWLNAFGALLFAQEKTFYLEEWYATTGQQAESIDRLVTITDASSNLYVAGSQVNDFGKYDLLLTKYDDTGYELWSTTFNVPDSTGNVIAADIALDNSGNVYITGGTSSASNSMDMLCVKYNSSGGQNWAQTVDGFGLYDVGSFLFPKSGGLLVLSGVVQKNTSSWVAGSITLNATSGALASSLSTSSGVGLEEATALAADGGDNIYIAGFSTGPNGKDFKTLKLDNSSFISLDWEAVYDGSFHGDDVPHAITFDGSGNVYVAGYTTTAAGRDFTVVKYNSSGTQQWVKLLDGAAGQDDEAHAIAVVEEEGNVVAAGFATQNGSRDYYTAILNSNDGATVWDATFNGLANKNDESSHVEVDSLGNITVLGKNQTEEPEATTYTTVRYVKKTILVPPDTEAASTAISFIENRGQLADSSGAAVEEVRFYNTSAYPPTYFHNDRISFVTAAIDTTAETPDTLHRVDMTFKNGKNDARAYGIGRQQAYHNYYLGHIPEGRARVGLYERAVQTDIYHKIDLMAYSNNAGVKYYFIIEPGGNPEDIQLEFDGQSGLEFTDAGGVEIETSVGEFELPPPQAYQVDAEGGRVEVEWLPEYEIEGDSVVHFGGIDEYDEDKHLVIEVGKPKLVHNSANDDWITYYGGKSDENATDIKLDPNGNIFVLSRGLSTNFPGIGLGTYAGSNDVIVGKFNDGGEEDWSFYWGGSDNETSNGLSITNSGQVLAVGETFSNEIPLVSPINGVTSLSGGSDGFVFKISNDGTELLWSSYVGGVSNDVAFGVNSDNMENVYIIGSTGSDIGFPTFDNGISTAFNQPQHDLVSSDAFILKFDAQNNQLWGTYFGGNGTDLFADIEVDKSSGDVYILGETTSQITAGSTLPCNVPNQLGVFPDCNPGNTYFSQYNSGPTTVNERDLIIVQFSPAGELKWSTYLGGFENEFAVSPIPGIGSIKIADLDLDGDILGIIGYSDDGNTFPDHTPGSFPGAFFQSVSSGGALICKFQNRNLVWSTGFSCGQTEPINRYGIDVSGGNIFIHGATRCSTPPEPFNYCITPNPSAGEFPICPLANSFFQDDDIFDGQALEAEFRGGGTDAFFAVFNSNNELVYSTYLGGNRTELSGKITTFEGGLYLVGSTRSISDFPVIDPGGNTYFEGDFLGGGLDGFIARINISNLPSPDNVIRSLKGEIVVFPNPVSETAIVKTGKGLQERIVKLFDVSGKKVWEVRTQKEFLEIDVSSLSRGVYFLHLNKGGENLVSKIIVQ